MYEMGIQTLETQFINYDGKTATVSIENPIKPVDTQAFSAAMDLIISTNVFLTPGGSIVVIRYSRIVEQINGIVIGLRPTSL